MKKRRVMGNTTCPSDRVKLVQDISDLENAKCQVCAAPALSTIQSQTPSHGETQGEEPKSKNENTFLFCSGCYKTGCHLECLHKLPATTLAFKEYACVRCGVGMENRQGRKRQRDVEIIRKENPDIGLPELEVGVLPTLDLVEIARLRQILSANASLLSDTKATQLLKTYVRVRKSKDDNSKGFPIN